MVFFSSINSVNLPFDDVITEIRMTSNWTSEPMLHLFATESPFSFFFSRLRFVAICKARGNFSFGVFMLAETLLANASSSSLLQFGLRLCLFNVKYPADFTDDYITGRFVCAVSLITKVLCLKLFVESLILSVFLDRTLRNSLKSIFSLTIGFVKTT